MRYALGLLLFLCSAAQADIIAAYKGPCPAFPATDQQPSAQRVTVGQWCVDYIGGKPVQADIDGMLTPIPQQISSMQAKVALSRAGLLKTVQAWVDTQSEETQLIWNTSTVFNRNSAIIMTGAVALGLSKTQLDTLFIAAATINP